MLLVSVSDQVAVPGTRFFFSTCSAGITSDLSRSENVRSTDCKPTTDPSMMSLDES